MPPLSLLCLYSVIIFVFLSLLSPSRGAPFSREVSTMSMATMRARGLAFAFHPPGAQQRLRTTTSVSYFSSVAMIRKSSSTADSIQQEEQVMDLIHPCQLNNGTIPYPKSLSPSAVMEFKKCPQSYLFQYLYGLRQPTNPALALGSMCHEALEKLFDLDPPDRTLQQLQNLFRSSWARHRLTKTYQDLFGTTSDSLQDYNQTMEREWGQSGLKLLENYYQVEDPRLVERPNPIQREIWIKANLSVDPQRGVTAHNDDVTHAASTTTNAAATFDDATFLVRGIVDRLDMVRISSHQVALRIVDYKTGKAPNLKYSQAMNEKIATEAFYQLKIYALLFRQTTNNYTNGLDLRILRLLFLTSESERGEYLDMDLGETQEERDVVLHEIHQDLANVWTSIQDLVATQDPKAFVGCDRSFCYCHKCRKQFVPGTVWEE